MQHNCNATETGTKDDDEPTVEQPITAINLSPSSTRTVLPVETASEEGRVSKADVERMRISKAEQRRKEAERKRAEKRELEAAKKKEMEERQKLEVREMGSTCCSFLIYSPGQSSPILIVHILFGMI